jgi:hypothetical protein
MTEATRLWNDIAAGWKSRRDIDEIKREAAKLLAILMPGAPTSRVAAGNAERIKTAARQRRDLDKLRRDLAELKAKIEDVRGPAAGVSRIAASSDDVVIRLSGSPNENGRHSVSLVTRACICEGQGECQCDIRPF